MPELLRTRGLTCRFGGLVAVDAVDLDVSANEIRALIGPNGAGKSTVLNLVTGIYRPTAGTIDFEGAPIAGLRPSAIARRGMARTFQTIRLWKQMTILENVMVGHQCRTRSGIVDVLLGTRRASQDESATREKALSALELVGLAGRAGQRAGTLSYGQQRLLEIARALATEPSLLLLDEPAAGMNPQEANALVDQIFRIRATGVAVLLIEHNMRLVMRVADRITVLSFGRKIAEGAPEEIRTNPEVISAYLGQAGDDVAA